MLANRATHRFDRNPSLDAPPTYEEVSVFTVEIENEGKNCNSDFEKPPTYDEATLSENSQTERF